MKIKYMLSQILSCLIGHKKTTTYDVGNPGVDSGQAKKGDMVKRLMGINSILSH